MAGEKMQYQLDIKVTITVVTDYGEREDDVRTRYLVQFDKSTTPTICYSSMGVGACIAEVLEEADASEGERVY